MTLLYRGVWQDDRPDLAASAAEQFQRWINSKGIEVTIAEEGHHEGTYGEGHFEVVSRRASADGNAALQIELLEERPGSGERWTTRLTVIEAGERNQWIWIDLERVADDSSQLMHWAAPRIARELIAEGDDVRVGQVRLTTDAHRINASGLAGLIRNVDRTIPIIVFSQDAAGDLDGAMRRANATASRLAGAVQVMVLTNEEVGAFKEIVGEPLGVWGGAARVYLPNRGPEGLRPHRHRYLARAQMGDEWSRPARTFAQMLGGTVTAVRPPEAYEAVRRELRLGRNQSDAEYVALYEQENARLIRERNELRVAIARLEDELLNTQVDFEEESARAAALQNQMQILMVTRDPASSETDTLELTLEPDSFDVTLSEARRKLHRLEMPDGIEHDIEELSSHVNGRSWAGITWRGLRALHTYADSDWDGNFKDWCTNSGHAWAWSANDKKLSMTESESVQNSQRLSAQRNLPVALEVSPKGRIAMWSHLKIAEGGGPQAPRVYFYDDTRGATGKVHIGFVGPHRYMENTRTN